jgi:hypothetical protein
MMVQAREDMGLDSEAREISRRFGFEYEDAREAIARSRRYFRDVGSKDGEISELASELVACAVEAAPRFQFSLFSMVEHMLLSKLHRVPSCKQFTIG